MSIIPKGGLSTGQTSKQTPVEGESCSKPSVFRNVSFRFSQTVSSLNLIGCLNSSCERLKLLA